MTMRQDGGIILVRPYLEEEMHEQIEEYGKVVGYVEVSRDFVVQLEMANEREIEGYAGEAEEFEDELAYMVIPDDYAYYDFSWSYSDLDDEYSDSAVLEVELIPDI